MSFESVYILQKEEKRRSYLSMMDEQWLAEQMGIILDLHAEDNAVHPTHRLNQFGFAESIVAFNEEGGLIMNLGRGPL